MKIFSCGSYADAEKITDRLMSNWLTYESGCGYSNDYCHSEWLSVIRQNPTGPFLGCAYFLSVQQNADRSLFSGSVFRLLF